MCLCGRICMDVSIFVCCVIRIFFLKVLCVYVSVWLLCVCVSEGGVCICVHVFVLVLYACFSEGVVCVLVRACLCICVIFHIYVCTFALQYSIIAIRMEEIKGIPKTKQNK